MLLHVKLCCTTCAIATIFSFRSIIIKKANESEGKSNASASWMMSPKKRFEELAIGCPDLLARVEKKEFRNNIERILQFAEALEKCK